MSTYDARSITVLRGLEAVRRRPAMYVGSTDARGVLQLVLELVHNAVDEARAGFAAHLVVTLDADGSVVVEDDGRGIPVDVHPEAGIPAVELVLTTLHAGGKFAAGTYDAPGGLHGVGLSCVNALSARLAVQIRREGGVYRQSYAQGHPQGPLARTGDAPTTGTRVRFLADPVIFGDARVPVDALRRELRAQAALHPGLSVRLIDVAAGTDTRWKEDTALEGLVAELAEGRAPVHPAPVRVRGDDAGVALDLALQWTWGWSEDLHAWVNGIATPQGGTHVEGMKAGIAQALNAHARARGALEAGDTLPGLDLREGLTAVLSVRIDEPEFEGQTKTALRTPSARGSVERVVAEGLGAVLAAQPALGDAIVERARDASRARAAARRAGERVRFRRVDYGFDRDVYRQQFGIRSKNWHQSARWITDSALLGAHAAACDVGPDARVLDVCCGSGVVGAAFRDRVGHITGLDITPEMVALARTRLDEVVQGDVYDIPFPDASFDLVVNREVLHLLPHPERPVAEVFRVLRPGGQFVFGQWVPYGAADAAWMFRIVKKKQPLFFNNLMDEDLRALLAGAGFVDITVREVLQWEDIDTWIDTWETPPLHRQQIRDLYHHAPAEVRAVHPFEIDAATGAIRDCWRWCVYAARKPA